MGANHAICIFTSVATHLIADVTAAYGPNPELHALPAPLRLIDTRNSIGWSTRRKIGPGRSASPTIQRSQITNSEWAGEALLNVTVADPDASGYLTVFPCGQSVPTASNLNFRARQTISNFVAVRLPPVGPAGTEAAICFQTTVLAHLIVDLEATVDRGAAEVTVPTPTRLLDSRIGLGATAGHLAGGTTVELQVTGRAGVSTSAAAVGMNMTVTEPSAGGYLTVYPCDQPVPTASNLNFVTDETIPNYVVARLDARGKVCVFSSAPTHVIADVATFYDTSLIDR